MRLFLAIEPDAAVVAALERVQAALRSAMGIDAPAVRWVPPSNAHVTLHFLGEWPAAGVTGLQQTLGARVAEPPFVATLGRAGCFPPHGRPSTVWVGVGEGAAAMQRLHGHLGHRLDAAQALVDTRTLSPHFTLGRVRDRAHRPPPQMRALIETLEVPSASWPVDHVTLFSSDLSGPAPRYAPIHRLHLVGA